MFKMIFIIKQFRNYTTNSPGFRMIIKRLKSNKADKFERPPSCERALKHFDDFYKAVFQKKWPSVRLALLSRSKQVAIVNNFGEVEKTEELLQRTGALTLQMIFQSHKHNISMYDSTQHEEMSNIGDILKAKTMEEERKEIGLVYPDVNKYPSDRLQRNKEKKDTEEEYNYDINNAMSSMHSDLAQAKLDTNRLILPDSDEGLLFDFVPATELRGMDGFIAESEYYKYYEGISKLKINIEEEHELDFPEYLKVYSFERGDMSEFPEPTFCVNNVFNFVTVDGGELLTALALDVKPEDHVLDMCSTSGNIAYCIFQTLRPKILVCPRNNNTEELFKTSLFDFSLAWKDMLLITNQPVDEVEDKDLYDKILVCVESTNDRNSLFNDEKNIFEVKKLKHRLTLPERQSETLVKALTLVRPGGTVLYSTTTLSPVQNDGVVCESLRVMHEQTKMRFTIKNLSPALAHTSQFFNYGDYLNLKFGILVVPFVPVNFGPRYFCKIVKNK